MIERQFDSGNISKLSGQNYPSSTGSSWLLTATHMIFFLAERMLCALVPSTNTSRSSTFLLTHQSSTTIFSVLLSTHGMRSVFAEIYSHYLNSSK